MHDMGNWGVIGVDRLLTRVHNEPNSRFDIYAESSIIELAEPR